MTDNNFNTPEGKIAKEVASQFISRKVGRHSTPNVRKEVEILLRLAVDIERDYGVTLNYLCNTVDVNKDGYFKFTTVAEDILKNGEENWGRIIILYAFAAKLAVRCKNNEQMINNIIYWLSCFIAKKSRWIRESGKGWDGFINQFCDPPNEKGWVKGLFAATVSFGTLAAILFLKNT